MYVCFSFLSVHVIVEYISIRNPGCIPGVQDHPSPISPLWGTPKLHQKEQNLACVPTNTAGFTIMRPIYEAIYLDRKL